MALMYRQKLVVGRKIYGFSVSLSLDFIRALHVRSALLQFGVIFIGSIVC